MTSLDRFRGWLFFVTTPMQNQKSTAAPSKARRSPQPLDPEELLTITLDADASRFVRSFCDIFAELPGDVASGVLRDASDALTGWTRASNYTGAEFREGNPNENALWLLQSVREARRQRLTRDGLLPVVGSGGSPKKTAPNISRDIPHR